MISAILAISENGCIGNRNQLPWPHIPEDMKWFQDKTTNHVVVMGSKTWDSLKYKPLKNRVNIVISSNDLSFFPGADDVISHNILNDIQLLTLLYPNKEIFIMGGKQIYEQCFTICDKLYITKINKNYKGDTKLNLVEILPQYELEFTTNSGICTFQLWKKRND